MEEDKIITKIYDRYLIGRLLNFGKPYWYLITLAVILITIGMGLEIFGPYLTKIAIDEYIIPGNFKGLLFIIQIIKERVMLLLLGLLF